MNAEIELLQRRIERERTARREAETILEQKALELYYVNNELRHLNEDLEQKVTERSSEVLTERTRLRSMITNLDSGILLENEQRKIVLVNEHFCQLFAIPVAASQLEGADCSQSAQETQHLFKNPEIFIQRIGEILERREICSDEILYLIDGRVLSRTFIPIFGEDRYLGHLWKYRDVTAEHRANETLRHSEEKYRGLIENMELGLLEVDTQDIIVRAYPRFCEMVGYEESEIIGKSAIDIFLVPEFVPTLTKQTEERLTGQAGVYEMQILKKGGERIWVLISGAPIFGPDECVIGSLGIHYDITKQKNLQRELEEARRNAEAAQEAEKQFLANMSHEIRTPLNAIIGMSHLLYDTQPNPEQREYLDILMNSAEMLRVLISDVLDLSKIRSGHLEIRAKEFDLSSMVRSMVKSAQLRLEDLPVKVEAKVDPAIRNLVVGDELLLHQVLSNLIGNAEKFTAQGKITVEVRITEESVQNFRKTCPIFEIRVSDTGIGIPPEKYELIFQSFRQVDGDIRRKFGGTGLGLAITRQIVELQGGTIQVESELGKGSCFIVRLPYCDSGKPAASKEKPELVFHLKQTKGKRLLVVEDNHMNRKYIGALLRKWGVQHDFAHNGREGVELAQRAPYDLILMDIQMPELDGYESCIAIRQSNNPNTNTPIVALTASALVSQKDKAFAAGMNDYLSKPFKPAQLFEKIGLFCGNTAAESPAVQTEAEQAFQFHTRLDSATLLELYGGDLDYARDMFDTFLKNTAPEFERLRHLLETNNYVELARLAHRIKPTCSMVGLPDLEQHLQELETSAKNVPPDPAQLERLLLALEADCGDALAAVASDLDKLNSL